MASIILDHALFVTVLELPSQLGALIKEGLALAHL